MLAFQSTHPVRGATVGRVLRGGEFLLSIHAPREGCDGFDHHCWGVFGVLSIHAPREGCDLQNTDDVLHHGHLSIHAPREGCDAACLNACWPCLSFQSTHPVRGATRALVSDERAALLSIHAPREGCDIFRRTVSGRATIFQSTHPVRGATSSTVFRLPTSNFQSTHPVRGATRSWTRGRSPSAFQSTHPVRGATREHRVVKLADRLSIHAPREGCDTRLPVSAPTST